MRRRFVRNALLGLAAAIGAVACVHAKPVRVDNQRGRRLVEIDRPTIATEFFQGRRVLRLDSDREENGAAGFSFAIELDDPGVPVPIPSERSIEFPTSEAKVSFVVAGDRGRRFWSRDARGTIRLRELGDVTLLVVDLEFRGSAVDPALHLPTHVFQDDVDRLRLSGAFEAK